MGEVGPPADSWARAALDFLERSREVADERVPHPRAVSRPAPVDLARSETSTSRREDPAVTDSRSAV